MAILMSAGVSSLLPAKSLSELASVSVLEMYRNKYSCIADMTLGSQELMPMDDSRMAQIFASFGRLSIKILCTVEERHTRV